MIAAELSQAQLLIAGLLSGSGVIALVVKFLMSSPDREAAAYKQGIADERARHITDMKDLQAFSRDQAKEIDALRTGLYRLAITSNLTPHQKQAIGDLLGPASTSEVSGHGIEQ